MGDTPEQIKARADAAIAALHTACDDDDAAANARPLARALRDIRDYPRLLQLAEALVRIDPGDAPTRRLQAQGLIESGLASVAVPALESLIAALPEGHDERIEATGLLGRAWKQIFFDASDKSAAPAQAALAAAVQAYRSTYDADTTRIWHGVNLLAVAHRARRLGLQVAPDVKPKALAQALVATLAALPEAARDVWTSATLAEASIALGDWDAVERHLGDYVARDDLPAFAVAATLRQFSEVWNIETASPRGQGVIDVLRARLLKAPDAEIRMSPASLQAVQSRPSPPPGQLEAVLGVDGPQTYEWWTTGLKRACSVAAIKRRLGTRVGTGFLVRAGDLGLAPVDELLVLTNFHVVNPAGQSPGVRPADAQVVFEAAPGSPRHDVAEIVWSAPPDRQDASLLRLRTPVTGIEPLPIAPDLPPWPVPPDTHTRGPRVYIVGHPGGRELSFSFQDNEMLGHEGPAAGRPPVAGIVRVHYRAPTEGGSSGSPVFNDSTWELIALHHMGGQLGMPRLNGEPGSYAANEGISIRQHRRRDTRVAACMMDHVNHHATVMNG